jgi:hypothetical protein
LYRYIKTAGFAVLIAERESGAVVVDSVRSVGLYKLHAVSPELAMSYPAPGFNNP